MLNWIVGNRTDYLHKMDLELNNLQKLIYCKTKQTKPSSSAIITFGVIPLRKAWTPSIFYLLFTGKKNDVTIATLSIILYRDSSHLNSETPYPTCHRKGNMFRKMKKSLKSSLCVTCRLWRRSWMNTYLAD